MSPGESDRAKGEHLAVVAHLQRRIDAVGPVPGARGDRLARRLPVDEDRAEARAPTSRCTRPTAEVVRGPDLAARVNRRFRRPGCSARRRSSRRPCRSGARRRGCRSAAPCRRQADPAREEQVDLLRVAELEGRRVLEEERPLLGEEQVEARQVDLLFVGLDLREVGVDRSQSSVRFGVMPHFTSTPTSALRSTGSPLEA